MGGTDGGATVNVSLATANAQAWTAFANGKLIGTGSQLGHQGGVNTITFPVPSVALELPPGGQATLFVLMSTSLGIDNSNGVNNGNTSASFSSAAVKGITSQRPGSVMLGARDLTARTWTHIAGSVGEAKGVFAEPTAGGVDWSPLAGTTADPMTWLSATFETPSSVQWFRATVSPPLPPLPSFPCFRNCIRNHSLELSHSNRIFNIIIR